MYVRNKNTTFYIYSDENHMHIYVCIENERVLMPRSGRIKYDFCFSFISTSKYRTVLTHLTFRNNIIKNTG